VLRCGGRHETSAHAAQAEHDVLFFRGRLLRRFLSSRTGLLVGHRQ
jgi:hypothetical protein